jgi:hypothetical protein
MKGFTKGIVCSAIFCLTLVGFPFALMCQDLPHPKTYIPSINTIEKHKKFYDDPRPYLKTFGPKQVLPKALYEKLIYNEEEMKKAWADVVGFKAPDVVGKIAPEIKPGKYTYKDVQSNPAFKQLMWADLYNRIKPGGPPMIGSIPEFEVVPTRQYYWPLPVSEATKRNEGKTKLDGKGYLVASSWESGYPFPKPAGKFKAQEVMYNVEKRYLSFGLDFFLIGRIIGFTKNLKMDFDGSYEVRHCRLAGRAQLPPLGYFDNRAKDRGEAKTFVMDFPGPRDIAGTAQSALYYLDPEKADQLMVYIPSMRRVRKMTATDTQDPIMGMDQIYDDNEGWMQKLSPTRYPYKFEIVEEREFLVPAPTLDGAEYITKSGEFRNVKMERRPMYVVKLTQLDPNYVYKYRLFYIDKETFNYYHIENYDRKDRLYRTWDGNYSFFPEMGTTTWSGSFILMRDHIDAHSSVEQPYMLPAQWNRSDVSIEGFMKAK